MRRDSRRVDTVESREYRARLLFGSIVVRSGDFNERVKRSRAARQFALDYMYFSTCLYRRKWK